MSSRLRMSKSGTLANLLARMALDLQAAGEAVCRARDEELRASTAQWEAAHAQLRRRGLDRAVDEPPVVGHMSWPSRDVEAEHPVRRYAAAVTVVAAALRRASASFREVPTRPEIRVAARSKDGRTSERTRIGRCCKRLVRWLVRNGMAKGIKAAALARAHRNPPLLWVLASAHQNHHAGQKCRFGGGDGCPHLAVCRALGVLVHGVDTPVTAALRSLANAVFDAAEVLDAVIPKVAVLETREHRVAALCVFSTMLTELDKEIRIKCLEAPYDRAPRGWRPRQALLSDASRYLEIGRFSDEQIAWFLDDGSGGDERQRLRRVRERLSGLAKEAPERWWLKYMDAATPEQIARAKPRSETEWPAGPP
jgi:hypothetical protein